MESLFEPYEENRAYGGYFPSGSTELAYRATMLDRAIRGDNVPQLKEAIDSGWINPSSRAFDNSYVVDYCDHRGAKQCAAYLREQGWLEWNS